MVRYRCRKKQCSAGHSGARFARAPLQSVVHGSRYMESLFSEGLRALRATRPAHTVLRRTHWALPLTDELRVQPNNSWVRRAVSRVRVVGYRRREILASCAA